MRYLLFINSLLNSQQGTWHKKLRTVPSLKNKQSRSQTQIKHHPWKDPKVDVGTVLSPACTAFVWSVWSTWCLGFSRSFKEGKWRKFGNRKIRKQTHFSFPSKVALTQAKTIRPSWALSLFPHRLAHCYKNNAWSQKERKQSQAGWERLNLFCRFCEPCNLLQRSECLFKMGTRCSANAMPF